LNETRGFITAVKSFFKEKAGCKRQAVCGLYTAVSRVGGVLNRCEFSNKVGCQEIIVAHIRNENVMTT